MTGDLGLLARVEYRFWVSFVLRDYFFFFFLKIEKLAVASKTVHKMALRSFKEPALFR